MKPIANSAAEAGWRLGPCWCGHPVQREIVDSGSALPNPIAPCCNSDNRCLADKAGASRKRAVGVDGWPVASGPLTQPARPAWQGEGGVESSAMGDSNRIGVLRAHCRELPTGGQIVTSTPSAPAATMPAWPADRVQRLPIAGRVRYGRWVQAEKAIAAMAKNDQVFGAFMIKTTNGNAIQNPLVGTANKAPWL